MDVIDPKLIKMFERAYAFSILILIILISIPLVIFEVLWDYISRLKVTKSRNFQNPKKFQRERA